MFINFLFCRKLVYLQIYRFLLILINFRFVENGISTDIPFLVNFCCVENGISLDIPFSSNNQCKIDGISSDIPILH